MNRNWNSTLMIVVMSLFTIPLFAGDSPNDQSRGRHHGVGRPDEVHVEGTISAVSDSSISVLAANGTQVIAKINSSTVLRRGDAVLTLADLAVGDEVRVEIATQPDGTLLALAILVSREGEGGEASVMGLVTATASDQLTVLTPAGSVTVEVNTSTTVRKGDTSVDFSAIVVGDFVEAEGTVVDATTILASRIHVEVAEAEPAELSGTVASVGTDSLTVDTDGGEINVAVSADTMILHDHQPILLSDIVVGDRVEVHGTAVDSTHINASRIDDESGSEPTEIHGTVTAVGADSIAVNVGDTSVTVSVVTTTRILRHGSPIAIADILVGDRVQVHGTATDATHLTATRIEDESETSVEPVELSGIVASIGDSEIVVTVDGNGVTVTITSATMIRRGGQAISIGDIHMGDRVEVHGIATDSTHVTASRIDDEAEHGAEPVELSGVVASIGTDQLVVTEDHGSVTVTVTSATIIRRGSHIIALADVLVGDRVEVHGTAVDSTHVSASEINDETESVEAELRGTVSSIDSGSLTIGTTTVAVTDFTSITKDGHAISFSDIAVGNGVEVRGMRVDATDVTATSINVESSDGGHDH